MWEVVVSVGALVAVKATVVDFAGTLRTADLADVVSGTVHVAVAGPTIGIAVVAETAIVAQRRLELGFALALAIPFGAVAR